QEGASVTKSPDARTKISSSVAYTGVVCAGRLLMSAASHKYRRFALVDCRRPGRGLPVVLEGGPLDGVAETVPLLAAGIMAVNTWPDGTDGELDYFYPLPKPDRRRRIKGRVVCRFSRRAVRA